MADNSQETAKRVRRGRGPGRPFPPGVSGNAGGRPKGIPNFSILRMILLHVYRGKTGFGRDEADIPAVRLLEGRGSRQYGPVQ